MKYEITTDYIKMGNSRSGQKLKEVKFIVSHDTGNPGSTAYSNRNYFNNYQPSASAHTFIDDKYILEIIPLDEKAWHVRGTPPFDNNLFGVNANDASIGVELAFGGNIDFNKAYDMYVWYHAYLVDKFKLNPEKHIVAHSTLDPATRTDPLNAFHRYGVSWEMFIRDVKQAYKIHFSNEENSETVEEVKGSKLPIRLGDKGSFVKELQQDLLRAGFSLPLYGADGSYGEETESAVMRFQKKYGITVDGIVGPITSNKLQEVLNFSIPVHDFVLPDKMLKLGDQGEEVKMLQRALKQIKFDPGLIDGIYGPKTQDAVRRFQSMYSALVQDGIYGSITRKYIKLELERT